jgi:type VI secretion system Hcp family effector
MIYVNSSDMPGGVTTKGFEKTFEALSISYGQSRKIGSRVGQTGRVDTSLAKVNEVIITKPYDVASTKAFEFSYSGKLLSKIVISLVRQDSSGPITYSEITLEDVVVSNYEFGIQPSAINDESTNNKPVETIAFNWGKMTVKNTPPGKDGTAGTPASTGWNLETNSKM